VESSCECGNELSSSIKVGKFSKSCPTGDFSRKVVSI
jgi:hypothetical protein